MSEVCKGIDIDRRTREPVKCDRAPEVGDLCRKHYQQERRDRLGKTIAIAEPGENAQAVFRLPVAWKDRIDGFAAARKITSADAYREAVEEYLKTHGIEP